MISYCILYNIINRVENTPNNSIRTFSRCYITLLFFNFPNFPQGFHSYARESFNLTIKIKARRDITLAFHCRSGRGWTSYAFHFFLRVSRRPDMSEHNKFYPLSSSGSPLLMLHSGINPRAYNERRPFMNTKSQEHVLQARIY